jgi:RNA polymerase sigma-70 factor (ECF subfamily)
VVDAFLTAARGGDFAALVSILDPDVVLRADGGILAGGLKVLRGVASVAGQLATFQRMATAATTHPALINGVAGLVNTVDDQVISVMNFTVSDGKIATIDILSDPDRLARLDFTPVQP